MPVKEQAAQAQQQRDADGDHGNAVLLLAQRAAAERGGDHRRNARHARNEQPRGQLHGGQAHAVGQQVLGRAGQHKDDEAEKGKPARVAKQGYRVDLLRREKQPHDAPAEDAHHYEHKYAAKDDTHHAQQAALPEAECVPRADFQRLTRQPGDDNL